jgi:hypothetical protein
MIYLGQEQTTNLLQLLVRKERYFMEQRATEYYQNHKRAFGDWQEGDISRVWTDNDGNMCIEYESGNWWHYNDKGEWW